MPLRDGRPPPQPKPALPGLDLPRLAALLRGTRSALAAHREFHDVLDALVDALRAVLPVESVTFHARLDDGRLVTLSGRDAFRVPPPAALAGRDRPANATVPYAEDDRIVLPLRHGAGGHPRLFAVLTLSAPAQLTAGLRRELTGLALPLEVMVERELLTRLAHRERDLLYRRGTRDPLTGLYNRQYMQDAVARLFAVQDREALPLSVVLFDVDHFQRLSDRFGQLVGDDALRAAARVMGAETRRGDVTVRLGGQEFALFAVAATAADAASAAERIRAAVARLELPGIGTLTVSAGVAGRRPGEQLEALFDRADAALYDARRRGRNRVAVA